MNSRLSEVNIFRTAKKFFAIAGLFALTLICAGTSNAQVKPAQTDVAAANSGATVPGTPPSTQASSPTTPARGATEKSAQTVAQNSSTKSPAPNRQHEGITVHGYWVIEVKNPDGKVVTHREFENALNAPTGGPLLTALMLGQNSPGAWAIGLSAAGNPTGNSLCTTPTGVVIDGAPPLPSALTNVCVIGQNGDFYFQQCDDGHGCFSTAPNGLATPTAALSQNTVATVTLMGQMTAEAPGNIEAVTTMLMTCPSTITPNSCPTTPTPIPGLATAAWYPPLILQVPGNGGPVGDLVNFFPFGIPLTLKTFAAQGSCGGTNQPLCYVPVTAQQVVSVTVQLSFQ
jgi:hypothetical protein